MTDVQFPTDDLSNNRAKLQNLEAATHFHLRKLAKRTGHSSVITLTGLPEWMLDPKRHENSLRLQKYLRETEVFDFVDGDHRRWLASLTEHYLLLRWARTEKPDLTARYVGLLWRLTDKKLNALYDFLDGGSGPKRVFF